MKSAVEKLSATKVKLNAKVPYEELKPSVEKVFKEFASQINVPGFRPGKAPAKIIEQRIGRGPVLEEAINDALPQLYADMLEEHKLTPLGQPHVDVTKTPNDSGPEGGDLEFDVTVEVRPEFDLPEMKGIEIKVAEAKADDAAVDEEIDKLRARFATLKPVDRAIKDGDFVTLDLKAEIDGKQIDSASQVSYEIGSGNMLDGMDKALKGMKAKATKTFTSKLAGGDHAGEEAEITVTPTAVKVRELPEVDEEFVQMVSEFDTVKELREDMAKIVAEGQAQAQAIEARDKLLEALLEKVDFPVPEGLLAQQVEAILGGKEKPTAKEKKDAEEEATKDLRTQILLDKLAEVKEVQVSQQELMEFIIHTAQAYGIDPSQFLSNAQSSNRLPMFIAEIARNKSLALSLGDVTVKDAKGKKVDISRFIQEEKPEE